MNASTAGSGGQIVVAGAGYAGLHVTLRLTAKLRNHPEVELTLVDRHDYHQAITELPRVASGTRAADAVRIPLQEMLATRVRFVQTEINGFDLAGRRLLTGAGPIDWRRLVLALGSRPNDFAIPGLAQRTLSLYSLRTPNECGRRSTKRLRLPRQPPTPSGSAAWRPWWSGRRCHRSRAGRRAGRDPAQVASAHGLAADRPAVQLVEAGPTSWPASVGTAD